MEAILEMVRVVRSGGRLVVLGVLRTGEYVRVLREGGMSDVERTDAYFLVFPSCIVTCRKPFPST